MVTLVERHSRFTALVKVPSKDTAVVVAALTRHVRKLPTALRRSLTWVADWRWASTRPSPWLPM
jgi:IS30 family transposase